MKRKFKKLFLVKQVNNITVNCNKNKNKKFKIESTADFLTLLEIYRSELAHRDNDYWRNISIFFLATVIVDILPFANLFNIALPKEIPNILVVLVGFFMTFMFWQLGKGFAIRVKASSDTYNALIEMLPPKYQRKTIENMSYNFIAKYNLSFSILNILTFLLIMLDLIALIYIIK